VIIGLAPCIYVYSYSTRTYVLGIYTNLYNLYKSLVLKLITESFGRKTLPVFIKLASDAGLPFIRGNVDFVWGPVLQNPVANATEISYQPFFIFICIFDYAKSLYIILAWINVFMYLKNCYVFSLEFLAL
jgi:hypothetical protein